MNMTTAADTAELLGDGLVPDFMSTTEPQTAPIQTAEQTPKTAPPVDLETALSQMVDNVKSQLADSKKIANDLKEQTIVFDKFGKQADNFFTRLNEELHTAIDRNFSQFAKDVDNSFKDRISEGLKDCIKDIQKTNDVNTQKLIDRAVRKNLWSFWLTALYGLACGTTASLAVYAITTNHKMYLWSLLTIVPLSYFADWWVHRE
jgi:hypothetical protein